MKNCADMMAWQWPRLTKNVAEIIWIRHNFKQFCFTFYKFKKLNKSTSLSTPNVHTTLNRRRIDIDITLIRRKENIVKFPSHFDIHFWCNFDMWKIDVVSKQLFRHNFNGQKIDVVSTYFVLRNFDEQKIGVDSMHFDRRNFNGQKMNIVLM